MGKSIIGRTKISRLVENKQIRGYIQCKNCKKNQPERNYYKIGGEGTVIPYCKECLISMCINGNGLFDETAVNKTMQLINKPFYYNEFMKLKGNEQFTERQKAQNYFHFISVKNRQDLTYAHSEDATDDNSLAKVAQNTAKGELPSSFCVDQNLIRKWNIVDKDKIKWLEEEYAEWANSYAITTKGQTELVKQICLVKWQITQYQIAGTEVPDRLYKSLSQLLGDAGLKPIQETDGAADSGKFSWGLLIKMIEENEPILPLTKPDYFDELNLKITGQLAKMEGFHNSVTERYDKYLDKYSVHEIEDLFEENTNNDALYESELEDKIADED